MFEEEIETTPQARTLGYSEGALWIEFRGEANEFPLDTQLDRCIKRYLSDNKWVYSDGNGCGTSALNRGFLRLVHAVLDVDFTPVCNLHDIGYSLTHNGSTDPVCVKSYRHKLFVDMAFEYNLLTYAKMHGKEGRVVRLLAFCYMMAVRTFGASHYWGDIPKDRRH